MLRAPLDSSAITAALSRYWRVSVVDLTASTQSDLVALVHQESAYAGDVIVAEYQSAGRGRLNRSFDAPKSTALLFSFYIKPQRTNDDWGWIPLIAGVSVAQTLSHFDAQVKWPNDILIRDKKVSGLIAEVVGDGIVVGIGINIAMTPSELPVSTATSLFIEGATNMTRNDLLPNLLNLFERNFRDWDRGSDEIMDTYRQMSATIGREVQVHYPDGRVERDTAASISGNGELILANGAHVQAGDVLHLR